MTTKAEAPKQAAETGRPVLTSIGQGKAVIHVDLRADQENVASELAAVAGASDVFTHGTASHSHGQPGSPGRLGFGLFPALAVPREATRAEAFPGTICPRQATAAG